MRLVVRVGVDNFVMVFSASTAVGDIIPEIEQIATELRDRNRVKIKALRSNLGVLMKSARLHEVVADGNQIVAILETTEVKAPVVRPGLGNLLGLQSWPVLPKEGIKYYIGDGWALKIDYSLSAFTWIAYTDSMFNWLGKRTSEGFFIPNLFGDNLSMFTTVQSGDYLHDKPCPREIFPLADGKLRIFGGVCEAASEQSTSALFSK